MACSIYAIVGAKGGVGKSAAAFLIGNALTRRGMRVAILDFDLGFRSQSLYFGVESEVVYNLSDLLSTKGFDLDKELKPCEYNDKLLLVPSCADPFTKLDFVRLADVCTAMRARFDYVIIDAPPSISRGFIAAVSSADSAIIVTTPDQLSVRSASLTAQIVTRAGIPDRSIIINKVDVKAKLAPTVPDFDTILDVVGARLLGVVPYEPELTHSLEGTKPVNPKAEISCAFDNIAKRMLGEKVELLIG